MLGFFFMGTDGVDCTFPMAWPYFPDGVDCTFPMAWHVLFRWRGSKMLTNHVVVGPYKEMKDSIKV